MLGYQIIVGLDGKGKLTWSRCIQGPTNLPLATRMRKKQSKRHTSILENQVLLMICAISLFHLLLPPQCSRSWLRCSKILESRHLHLSDKPNYGNANVRDQIGRPYRVGRAVKGRLIDKKKTRRLSRILSKDL